MEVIQKLQYLSQEKNHRQKQNCSEEIRHKFSKQHGQHTYITFFHQTIKCAQILLQEKQYGVIKYLRHAMLGDQKAEKIAAILGKKSKYIYN